MSEENKFLNIGYEDFRRLAQDDTLSKYERIGFPDNYREGHEGEIYSDIVAKLSNLKRKNQTVLDIGPGCSDLPLMLIEQCRSREHNLHMIDNPEMLDQLPNHQFITKIAGLYPNCTESLQALLGKVDVIICYSVLHYVLIDTAFFSLPRYFTLITCTRWADVNW